MSAIQGPMDTAQTLKDEGNVLFKSSNHIEAIVKYQSAVDIISALLLPAAKTPYKDRKALTDFIGLVKTNIAASHIKLQNFDIAVAVSLEAIDSNFVFWKAHLRKAEGLVGLLKFEEAFATLIEAEYNAPTGDVSAAHSIAVLRKAIVQGAKIESKKPENMFRSYNLKAPVAPTYTFADDKGVALRTDKRFKVPVNFSREVMQTDCGYCAGENKYPKRHARNACCSNPMQLESHSGVLEFISWEFDPSAIPKLKKNSKSKRTDDDDDDDDFCSKLTWGAIPEDEVDWFLKDGMFDSWQWDYRKVFNSSDYAFRWTCCGMNYGEGVNGCDHHGARGRCSCDYCKSGRKYKIKPSQTNRFLKFNGIYKFSDWDVIRGIPWTTESHKYFPEEFKQAVKCLLTCRASGSGPVGLQAIPNEVMLMIIGYMIK